MTFLRDRSPVTPKSTRPHGPAMRGSRRSCGTRSGFDVTPTSPPPVGAVEVDQPARRGVLLRRHRGVAREGGADLHRELLAELDAPLVEAVDAPHGALGERDVLV